MASPLPQANVSNSPARDGCFFVWGFQVMIVGRHSQSGWVTMDFNQVVVDVPKVDFSHGDCGNMLAAVGPFALEKGLVEPEVHGQKATVRIHSANTGACYEAEVWLGQEALRAQGLGVGDVDPILSNPCSLVREWAPLQQ